MADRKYGRLFTENDVIAIIERVANAKETTGFTGDQLLKEVIEGDGPFETFGPLRLKFDKEDEPLFVLRARDRRALGAVTFYRDHQSPRAPIGHLDGIEAAVRSFSEYREEHPGEMKEPD